MLFYTDASTPQPDRFVHAIMASMASAESPLRVGAAFYGTIVNVDASNFLGNAAPESFTVSLDGPAANQLNEAAPIADILKDMYSQIAISRAKIDEEALGFGLGTLSVAIEELSPELKILGPVLGVEEDGSLVLEWLNAERRLSVFFGKDTFLAIKSWGENIHSDMDEAPGNSGHELASNLRWLAS